MWSKKEIKWNYLMVLLLNMILVVSLTFYLKNKKCEYNNDDIIKIYELQIDSIKNEINNREKIIISLNDSIRMNDDSIKKLNYVIVSLDNDRVKIKKDYESKDKELKKMSNDSIVIYVREQLMLWTER